MTIPSKALPVAQERNSQLKKDGLKFTHSPYSLILCVPSGAIARTEF
ncbi:hypothetical protein QUA54_13515 [Microcoleus sp. MOSTC5]